MAETAQQTIWTEELRVKTYETDLEKKWKPASVLEALNEIAAVHAAHLGFDYHKLAAHQLAWVLSRVKIVFHDYPQVGEPVTLRTWPKGMQQKLFFVRDTLILDKNGKTLASASSAWLLINIQARRLASPNALPGSLPDNNSLRALDEPLEKISMPQNMSLLRTVEASYNTVDLMGHVNSARYLEWITDCFPAEQFIRQRPEWVQINYVNEIKPGTQVEIHGGVSPDDPQLWAFYGGQNGSKAPAFEAALRWHNLDH